jgi:hypothetical protein
MKLAELCTAYPSNWNAPAIVHPGDAIPMAVRLKLRAQRGWLQAALDTHVQRSSNRSGLGLRPYMAGDSLRAISSRHLLLQEELLTRTDVSPGRFHVAIIVHCYENMQFHSDVQAPNKMQAAWATAGLLQNLHEQQAQKVEIVALQGKNLSEEMLKHAGRLKRAHFCYVITDLLFDPSNTHAATNALATSLKHLRVPRGMVVVVRDPLESPDISQSDSYSQGESLAFAAPDSTPASQTQESRSSEFHSGQEYLMNVNEQLNFLESNLNNRGWSSIWLTAEHEVDSLSQRLTSRLSALRVGS